MTSEKQATFDSGASRIAMLIRLVGIVFLAIGAALTYFTYSASSSIVPQIVPVFYLGAVLLMIVGIVAIVAKYK
jgi:flagellar basal body-associated protein FliL